MSTLTGAAEDSVARSALHKRAKRRILDRDTLAPADVEALLRSVYALTPANRRRKLDEEGEDTAWRPKEGPARWLREQRAPRLDIAEKPGWALQLIEERLAVPLNLDVFTEFVLSEPPTSVYYTGHGIGHQYRPDVAL